jgi:murein DD-endopeptidase MepM/ murein hydrolase activator NlpD
MKLSLLLWLPLLVAGPTLPAAPKHKAHRPRPTLQRVSAATLAAFPGSRRPVPGELDGLVPADPAQATLLADLRPFQIPATEPQGATRYDPLRPELLNMFWPVASRTISAAWGTHVTVGGKRVRKGKGKARKVIRARFSGQHKGLDLTAPTGTEIFAALDGEVLEAKRHKDYGNYLLVDHGDGLVTLYAHAKTLFVRTGSKVVRGQKIAAVGRTGMATGPHLHFEVRIDGRQTNPLPMLNDADPMPASLLAQNLRAR